MNAYSRTLPLPGVARPVRESGSSALDRVAVAWPAPDPASRVIDPWSAPSGPAVFRTSAAPWAAPDPVMRFDLPAPVGFDGPRIELIEPTLPVPVPDLAAASRVAMAPIEDALPAPSFVSTLPPPSLADAAPVADVEVAAAALAAGGATSGGRMKDRSGASTRLVVGLAAAAGIVAAGTLTLFAIF